MKKNNDYLEKYMEMAGCKNDIICYENINSDKNLSISNNKLFIDLRDKMYNDYSDTFIFAIGGIIYYHLFYIHFLLF